jgi:hypothetical protein
MKRMIPIGMRMMVIMQIKDAMNSPLEACGAL